MKMIVSVGIICLTVLAISIEDIRAISSSILILSIWAILSWVDM